MRSLANALHDGTPRAVPRRRLPALVVLGAALAWAAIQGRTRTGGSR